MSYLSPVGWADVATKQDLESLRIATKQDLESLRMATKQDLVLLRSEMATMRAELRGEIERGFKEQLRWLVGTLVGMTAIFGVIVGLFG
jgi:hypothetical protein